MRIDEPGRNHQTGRVNRPRGIQMSFARVADEDDAIAANAHIRSSWLLAGTIDELAVEYQ